jgi:hypothetical protein
MPAQSDFTQDHFQIPFWNFKEKQFSICNLGGGGGAVINGSDYMYTVGAVNFLMFQMLSTLQIVQQGAWTKEEVFSTNDPTGNRKIDGYLVGVAMEITSVSPDSDWLFGTPNLPMVGRFAFGTPDDYFEPWQPVSFEKAILRAQYWPASQYSWYFRPGTVATFHARYIPYDDKAVRVSHAYNSEEGFAPFNLYGDGSPVDFPELWPTFDVFPPRIE